MREGGEKLKNQLGPKMHTDALYALAHATFSYFDNYVTMCQKTIQLLGTLYHNKRGPWGNWKRQGQDGPTPHRVRPPHPRRDTKPGTPPRPL